MIRRPATAKINLALVVGATRADGKHEVATILQRLDLADRVALRPASGLEVHGFVEDSLVRAALVALAEKAGTEPAWAATITKRIPVAAGLGGGSSDAATALLLANETLPEPLPDEQLTAIAAGLGADIPFFLTQGPQLGEGDGTGLAPLELPQDYYVVLILPGAVVKTSTAEAYAAFDERGGAKGFRNRRAALRRALAQIERPRDLAALPPNDLASSPVADELLARGAFRADVSGAGPTVYGLFTRRDDAAAARKALGTLGKTWLTVPAWYG
jgi:4-diphosphocytidyl-2-C-methyl-D-erythritol kinase